MQFIWSLFFSGRVTCKKVPRISLIGAWEEKHRSSKHCLLDVVAVLPCIPSRRSSMNYHHQPRFNRDWIKEEKSYHHRVYAKRWVGTMVCQILKAFNFTNTTIICTIAKRQSLKSNLECHIWAPLPIASTRGSETLKLRTNCWIACYKNGLFCSSNFWRPHWIIESNAISLAETMANNAFIMSWERCICTKLILNYSLKLIFRHSSEKFGL